MMTREASIASQKNNSSQGVGEFKIDNEQCSGEKPRRIPGVSACLNKGVLPRQHKHIKQVISMIAAQ